MFMAQSQLPPLLHLQAPPRRWEKRGRFGSLAFARKNRGRESPRRREGGGGPFFIENPRRGGVSQAGGGGGARGREGVCGELGGGAKYIPFANSYLPVTYFV